MSEVIHDFQARIIEETERNGYDGHDIPKHKWNFSGALLYSITVITTIGETKYTEEVVYSTDMGQYQIFVQYQYQYFLKFGSQNQYQYQNSSKSFFNIKINIKIKIFQNSISKSISKFLKVENQYQNQHQYSQNIDIDIENQKILGFKSLLLTPLDFYANWGTKYPFHSNMDP